MKRVQLWTISFFEKEGLSFVFQERASSSNDLASHQVFKSVKNPILFLVEHQTQGRGSQGRQWQNSDLMLSFLWHKTEGELNNQSSSLSSSLKNQSSSLKAQARNASSTSSLFKNKNSSLSLSLKNQSSSLKAQACETNNSELSVTNQKVPFEAQACEDFAKDVEKALKKTWQDLEISFKAPNDLYLNDKKLAGLLMEVLSQGSKRAFILGLGLNVFKSPKNLPASCLKDQVKDLTQTQWQKFLSQLLQNWSNRLINFN